MRHEEVDTLVRFAEYLRLEKGHSGRTIESYLDDLKLWVSLEGGLDPETATSEEILSFVRKVDTRRARKSVLTFVEHGDSPRSIARRLSALRSFYTYLLKHGEVESNPFHAIRPPKSKNVLPTFVSSDALSRRIEELYATAQEASDEAEKRHSYFLAFLIDLLFQTGMRSSEVTGLALSAVDLSGRRIRVRGKGDKERIIPFGPGLAKEIEHYLSEIRTPLEPGEGHFLISEKGRPVTHAVLYRLVREALDPLTNYSRKSPHILRHSFATALLNDGADLLSVKELLGHESVSTTGVYTHTTLEELRKNYTAHPRSRKKEEK